MFIDAIGKACPMPVIMARKELLAGCAQLSVAVDNEAAVGNLTRLGQSLGLSVTAETQQGGTFLVHFQGGAELPAPQTNAAAAPPSPAICNAAGCGYAVLIGKDHLGEGAEELGYNLLKMALYTLAEGEAIPASLLFINGGVKLPSGEDQQIVDNLRVLQERGAEVLVCGACLNFYGLTEQLKTGRISNMYEIWERMHNAAKVITL